MKIERTKNASRNIVFGTLLKLYQVIGPFLMRMAMIYLMGVQYLGLNSLFTSILQVLNLAELGVGSAMIYSMYKPIADDNKTMICALMKLYRTYYRVIGLVIALVGGFLTPFRPRLISGEAPNGINIYVLYLLNLGATVLSYWLFAYKNSILQAFQRTDIVSKVSLFTITVQYGLQLLILVVFKNYYLYVLVMLITQALTNIITAIVADRMYPEYKPQGNVDKKQIKQINQRIKDLFKTSNGKYIAPQAIETKLVVDRYIDQISIIADQRKFVSALIVPEYGQVKKYAEEHHIAYTDMKDLLQKQEILDLFRLRIDTLQQEFAHYEQIKRFTLLPEPFSMEKGELTNTLKIKRPVLMKNYAKEIEKMYEE